MDNSMIDTSGAYKNEITDEIKAHQLKTIMKKNLSQKLFEVFEAKYSVITFDPNQVNLYQKQ